MEGAVDQAVFLASVDIPIAIIGARGTGKMYIAKVVHQAAAGTADGFRVVDCRELRSREQAFRKICALLDSSEGDTLVLKSPQLMHPETQDRLARMISTRTFVFERPITDSKIFRQSELGNITNVGLLLKRKYNFN